MELERISQLLRDAEAQPSAQCWERLSEQLGTLPAAAASSSVGKTVLKRGLSAWAKAGIGAAAAAVVTVAAVLLTPPAKDAATPSPTSTPTTMQTPAPVTATPADTILLSTSTQKSTAPETAKNKTPHHAEPSAKEVTEVPTAAAESPHPAAEKNESPTMPALASQPEASPSENKLAEETRFPQENLTTSPSEPVQEPQEPDVAEVELEIPNVITPNGDGLNDVFVIQHLETCTQHRLIIKNQAGKQVLSTQHYANDWGTDAAAGTYFYQLAYTVGDVTKYRNGVITVVR